MVYQALSPLIVSNFIDSCAFDPKYEPEASASVEIFKLSESEEFILEIAHSTQKEIDHPNTPGWVKKLASGLNYSISVQLTPNEKKLLNDVEVILAGNGKIENIKQDAWHVFEAAKYGHYFITTDKRILARADALRERSSVNVLPPTEFLASLKKYIVIFFFNKGGIILTGLIIHQLQKQPACHYTRHCLFLRL